MTEREELVEKAKSLDLEFKGNIKTETLRVLVEEREIELKASAYEKPTEESKKAVKATKTNADIRREALLMKRCIITPLAETSRNLPSEMFSIGSPKLGFIKKVVRFNVETLEPKVIIDHLEEKKTLLQIKSMVDGKPVVTKRLSKAYSVQILPDLTKEEFAKLAGKN